VTRTRLSLIASALGLIALIALAGCGGSSSSTSTNSSASAAGSTSSTPSYGGSSSSAGSGGAATVDVAGNPELGQVLVDSQGRTMYLFEKDESDESYCNGSCAKTWPPVTTQGMPKAGSGVSASKLTTLKRDDGTTQVVFDGHPIYLYASDTKPGDATLMATGSISSAPSGTGCTRAVRRPRKATSPEGARAARLTQAAPGFAGL